MAYSFVIPRTFATTMGGLVELSGAMKSLTKFMPGVDSHGEIPGSVAPLVDLNGSREEVDARKSFSKLHVTVTNMNKGVSRLCSTIPMRTRGYRKTDRETPRSKGQADAELNRMTPGFSSERSHLQDVINRQVAAVRSEDHYTTDKRLRNVANFLLRLQSLTGRSVTELTNSLSDIGVREWIEGFSRMSGMHSFSVLEGLAKRRLTEKEPLMSGSSAKVAERIFEQAVLFSSVEDMDIYARQMTEKKFTDASRFFEEVTLLGAAAIASDFAARVWDRLDQSGPNPHAAETARLLQKSIEQDLDVTTFGIRYLYGLHYADRAADWAAKQKFFAASVAYYNYRGFMKEVANASIREAHAFSQRKDKVTKEEWWTISQHLSMAIEFFKKGSSIGRDGEILASLKEARGEAESYVAHASDHPPVTT